MRSLNRPLTAKVVGWRRCESPVTAVKLKRDNKMPPERLPWGIVP